MVKLLQAVDYKLLKQFFHYYYSASLQILRNASFNHLFILIVLGQYLHILLHPCSRSMSLLLVFLIFLSGRSQYMYFSFQLLQLILVNTKKNASFNHLFILMDVIVLGQYLHILRHSFPDL